MFPRSLFQGKVLGFFFLVKKKGLNLCTKDDEERERDDSLMIWNISLIKLQVLWVPFHFTISFYIIN